MHAPRDKPYDVLVMGCGLMGVALARTLAQRGHIVAAWNRTPEKAQALAVDGITAVEDIEEAVRSSHVVLACTATYGTTRAALDDVSSWEGSALINVGTGVPDEVDEMEQWARARGVSYLDGSILCYPQHVGTPAGLFLFSGPSEAWHAHETMLAGLGTVTHVSTTTRGASLLDVTMSGGFYIASLAAYAEAASYALGQGLTAAELTDVTQAILDLLSHTTSDIARAIETGQHDTDQATITVFAAGAELCRGAMQTAGHRALTLTTATELLGTAQAAGLGNLGFSALTALASHTQD